MNILTSRQAIILGVAVLASLYAAALVETKFTAANLAAIQEANQ